MIDFVRLEGSVLETRDVATHLAPTALARFRDELLAVLPRDLHEPLLGPEWLLCCEIGLVWSTLSVHGPLPDRVAVVMNATLRAAIDVVKEALESGGSPREVANA